MTCSPDTASSRFAKILVSNRHVRSACTGNSVARILRLSGQLPSRRQAGSVPLFAGPSVLGTASWPRRLPRLFCGAPRAESPAMPAVWHRHFDVYPDPMAVSGPHSDSPGQLMMSTGGNPQPPRRCLARQGTLHVCRKPIRHHGGTHRHHEFLPQATAFQHLDQSLPAHASSARGPKSTPASISTHRYHPAAEQNPLKNRPRPAV